MGKLHQKSKKSKKIKKICRICGEKKVLSHFPKNKAFKDGHTSRCKNCEAEYQKEYHARPEVIKREKQRNKRRVNRGDFKKKEKGE